MGFTDGDEGAIVGTIVGTAVGVADRVNKVTENVPLQLPVL